MVDQPPFTDPMALTAYLEANGWKAINNVAVGSAHYVVARIFEPEMELPYMMSAQIIASEDGGMLQLGFGTSFQQGQTAVVARALTSIASDIFAKSGLADPLAFLAQAFSTPGEHAIYRGALNVDVVVLEPDDSEDSESFSLGLSRDFAPSEWQQWVADGLFDAGDALLKQAEALCRERLRRHSHALADVPLTLVVGTSDYFMFTAPDGKMVILEDMHGTPAISVMAADGTIETLD